MSDDHFQYDLLMMDAHRELIRQVLLKVEQTGLPGEHHFFIIFSTTHEGTSISDRLKAQYPQEMTIVLQHQYSNLKIHKDRFEIQLSFNRIPELLVIPFDAITGFVDPSVPFGLQLAGDSNAGLENSIGMLVPGLPQATSAEESEEIPLEETQADITASSDHSAGIEFLRPPESEVSTASWKSDKTSVPTIFPAKSNLRDVSAKESYKIVKNERDDEDEDEDDEVPANIVHLDAFRKKSK